MYIEKYHTAPPVLFDDLLKLDLDPELRTAINVLLEAKKRTTEKEENPQMPVKKKYVEEEKQKQKIIADELADDHIIAISKRLMTQNKEAYEVLAK